MKNNFNTITPEKEYNTYLTPVDEYNKSNSGGLNNWTETTLGEVSISKQYGYTESASLEIVGPKFLRITDIQDDFINWETVPYCPISKTDYKKYKLEIGDIVIARTGNSTGATAVIKDDIDAVFASYLIRFKLDYKKANFIFIDFLLRSDFWKGFVKSVKGGSAQGGANANNFAEFPILLPPLEEQKAIASVLSAFDDKIELLREQNKTLEEMGHTIFQEWFIKDTTIYKQRLGDLVEVKRGGSPRPIQEFISETGYRWLKISDASATASPFIFDIKECIKEEGLKSTTLLKAGSLVLSNSATPGMPKILAVDSCIHDGWLHFPKSRFSNEFLYLLFQEIRPQLIQQGSGSVFTNLKTDILKDYESPLPSNEILQNFDNIIKPIFEKIYDNANQIQSLSRTRDELLPRLMRGELRVVGN